MRKSSIVVSCVVILASFNLPGCTSAKVTDCNSFGKINQEIKSSFDPFQAQGRTLAAKEPKNVAEFKQLAKDYMTFSLKVSQAADKSNKSIEAMKLTDEKLKGYQTQYLALTKKIKDAYEKLSVIHAEQSTVTDATVKDKKFQQLGEKVDAIAETQKSLVQEENKLLEEAGAYCGVKTVSPSPSATK
jgi:hypothetical protein